MPSERAEPPYGVDERVVRALSDRPGHLAFGRLRRDLKAHPETLTRSLRRLERLGTVGHDALGYFLVDRPAEPTGAARPAGSSHELASVRLPPSVDAPTLLGLLAGRWFGPVRWVGSWEEEGGTALAWEVPGREGWLVLRWIDGSLSLRAELARPGPVDPALLPASEELLLNALRRVHAVSMGIPALEVAESGRVELARSPGPMRGFAA